MSASSPHVHIVDDDEAFRDSLVFLLESHDYAISCHDSAEALLENFQPQGAGCLIVDIRMPGMSGLELFDELSARHNPWPVIFITGHGDVPMAVQAVKRGAHDFLEKPFNQQALLTAVDSCEQGLLVERFFQEVVCATFDGLHRHWHITMPGDEDDRPGVVAGAEFVEQFQPAHAGHADVHDQAAGPLWLEVFQQGFGTVMTGDGVIVAFQQENQ